LKRGIYLETKYHFNNQTLYCDDVYTLFLNELSTDWVVLGRMLHDDTSINNMYEFKRYSTIYKIEYYDSLFHLYKILPFYYLRNKNLIRDFVLDCDMILIMTPSPIGSILLKYAIKFNKEYCLLIRQDSTQMIPSRFSGIKKIIAKLIADYSDSSLRKKIQKHNSKILALGPVLTARYENYSKRVYNFASSRYKLSDIINESDLNILDNSNFKILFVGRIEINKGIDELLRALNEFNNCKITIVGNGKYLNQAKLSVNNSSLRNRINFMGYIPFGQKLLAIYQSHDIFILPSYSEGLPQVILEAMACGCVVLASNVGSIPNVIKHEVNGLLFQPRSTTSLIEQLDKIINNRYNLTAIRLNALKTAKEYAFENQSATFTKALSI
jgi:L-malate glycosyltransferase